jgi:hypothetical protein
VSQARFTRWPEDPRDRSCQRVPLARLRTNSLTSCVFTSNDRRERAVFDLQDIIGVELDCLGDGVAVGRRQQQRAQNQQVQSTLQQLDAIGLFFSRRSR